MNIVVEGKDICALAIEESVVRYYQNKDINSEKNEENKLLKEEILLTFAKMNVRELVVELPDGKAVIVKNEHKTKETLDKERLVHLVNQNSKDANLSYITTDDLKTPFDWSILTKQNRITPGMISECTEKISETVITIKKMKQKKKKAK